MRSSALCSISPCGLLIIIFLSSASTLCRANEPLPSSNKTLQQRQLLATVYQNDIVLGDYWISEKLDGIRARWNGTKLLTRNGNIIHVPAWFVKELPPVVLDGELWLARNSFEKTASIVLRKTPTEDWKSITFMLFDLPEHTGTFSHRLTKLHDLAEIIASPHIQVIPHFKLETQNQLMEKLDDIVAQGAEGLMLHHQNAYYQDGRSSKLLKLKKLQDAEATVIAHFPGKGKYQKMLGSLLVELDSGLKFKIGTGFSDEQRKSPPAIGSVITFKYYGLTAKGIPRFASFLRIRPKETRKIEAKDDH